MTAEQTEAVEPRTYYSRVRALSLHAALGKKVLSDGEVVRLGEKVVEFQPINAEHGQYVTDDPEVIAYLEKRVKEKGDVMTTEQYNEAITPAQVKIDYLRDKVSAQDRLIEEQNRLIASLRATATSKVPVPTKQ
jgi:hypothetical protein